MAVAKQHAREARIGCTGARFRRAARTSSQVELCFSTAASLCGIFGAHRRNSARLFISKQLAAPKTQEFLSIDPCSCWRNSCLICGEHNVFRSAVVSIVLTLAVVQNAALLCGVRCHLPEVASGACEPQHQATSPSVTGNDSCTQFVAGATAFVREDVRRGPAPDAHHGVVVAWFQFAPPQAYSTSGRQLRQQTPFRASPQILALRI